MGKIITFIAVFLFLSVFSLNAFADARTEAIFNSSGLEIPRFVSLRSDKVFVRSGPALRYPIKWVYKREGLPVEIIQEFDTWRKIRDYDGEEGWIHQSLLSGRRSAIISSDVKTFMFKKPKSDAKKLALIEKGGVLSVEKCIPLWCKGKISGFSGWVERKSLWGVYDTEKFD